MEDAGNQIPVSLLWMLESEAEPGRLWIGSEGGVTQFDGRTWGTLSQDDGLQSATAYAIARAPGGGHWIGGATGLSYYEPDNTPPWVRVESTSGGVPDGDSDGILAPIGGGVSVSFSAGDLQTLQHKLHLLQRIVGPKPAQAEGAEASPAPQKGSGPDADLTAVSDGEWVQGTAGALDVAAGGGGRLRTGNPGA